MYNGELIISTNNGDNIYVTNHSVFNVDQRFSSDKKVLQRIGRIEAERPFAYSGVISTNDKCEGVIRITLEEKEVVKYFSGVIVYLSEQSAKIRLDGELSDNINEFLKKIERYEYSR